MVLATVVLVGTAAHAGRPDCGSAVEVASPARLIVDERVAKTGIAVVRLRVASGLDRAQMERQAKMVAVLFSDSGVLLQEHKLVFQDGSTKVVGAIFKPAIVSLRGLEGIMNTIPVLHRTVGWLQVDVEMAAPPEPSPAT